MLMFTKVNNAENHLNKCFPDDFSTEDLIYFEFAPIILMEANIIFLKYKYLPSHNHHSINFENFTHTLLAI